MSGYVVKRISVISLFLICNVQLCNAYSVLTHEAIIDANWENILLPLLKEKYPGSTDEALKEAHAYAYGGSVVPDMGYYPFGSKLFTNLIHYVRTGDFIETLFRDAQNINDYAFAAGVLCHYYADAYGHKIGINISVPVIYPKMQRRFGDTVTFAEDHISHVRTEFSFDVLQTARGNYASTAYHDFIGFKIAEPLLEKTFMETYGLNMDDLFGNFSKATSRFRWAVINVLPFVTKAAWASKKSEIKKLQPTATSRGFIFRMHRKNYIDAFGENDKPKLFAHVVSVLIPVLPKVGPLRALKFKAPSEGAESIFVSSFDVASAIYAYELGLIRTNTMELSNLNFDTGLKTRIGEYAPVDQTYCKLLLSLKEKRFSTLTSSLKQNILSFYLNHHPAGTNEGEVHLAMDAIAELKLVQPVEEK